MEIQAWFRDLVALSFRRDHAALSNRLGERIPESAVRERIARFISYFYYVRHDGADGSLDGVLESLIEVELNLGLSTDSLLAEYAPLIDGVIQDAVQNALGRAGEAQALLRDIFKSPEAAELFVECSRTSLLPWLLHLASKGVGEDRLVQLLTDHYVSELCAARFLQRMQLDRMRYAMADKKHVVAFFCPDQAFRKNFGNLPHALEQAGHGVLYLFGQILQDEFESHATSYYVGGGLQLKIDFVDLFITATSMDALPEQGKKALVIHGSFAPFTPERAEPPQNPVSQEAAVKEALDLSGQYQRAVAARSHFSAFFRLYDFYIVSTAYFRESIKGLGAHYNLVDERCQVKDHEKALHSDFQIFNKVLAGRRLPDQICIVPVGYPQVDANIRTAASYQGPKLTLTYAPTPLNGKPVWNQYSSLYNAGVEIVGALLNGFPEYEIVFKPHIEDRNEQTLRVIQAYEGRPRFRVDWGGSNYMDLYARTAVLISDFSSTAYTFALSTLRPVLFFSPAEANMPDDIKAAPYCRNRQAVGRVAATTQEMVEAIHALLHDRTEYVERIRRFREANLFHVGRSEEYLCEAVGKMLVGETQDEWVCLR